MHSFIEEKVNDFNPTENPELFCEAMLAIINEQQTLASFKPEEARKIRIDAIYSWFRHQTGMNKTIVKTMGSFCMHLYAILFDQLNDSSLEEERKEAVDKLSFALTSMIQKCAPLKEHLIQELASCYDPHSFSDLKQCIQYWTEIKNDATLAEIAKHTAIMLALTHLATDQSELASLKRPLRGLLQSLETLESARLTNILDDLIRRANLATTETRAKTDNDSAAINRRARAPRRRAPKDLDNELDDLLALSEETLACIGANETNTVRQLPTSFLSVQHEPTYPPPPRGAPVSTLFSANGGIELTERVDQFLKVLKTLAHEHKVKLPKLTYTNGVIIANSQDLRQEARSFLRHYCGETNLQERRGQIYLKTDAIHFFFTKDSAAPSFKHNPQLVRENNAKRRAYANSNADSSEASYQRTV